MERMNRYHEKHRTALRVTTLLQTQHDVLRNAHGFASHDALDALLGTLLGWNSYVNSSRARLSRPPTLTALVGARDHVLAAVVGEDPAAAYFKRTLPESVQLALIQGLYDAHELSINHQEFLHQAMMSFLDGVMRREMGSFFTPSPVVNAMVACAAVSSCDAVLDPACGTGVFLCAASRCESNARLRGVDRDLRSAIVARLALADHRGSVEVQCADFLGTQAVAPAASLILTNPPFGKSPADSTGDPREIRFIERSLETLSEHGRLWIIVPRSVFSNRGLDAARARLDTKGTLRTVIELPPETFALTGAAVATAALEFVKGKHSYSGVSFLRVHNVGHDATGRPCEGEDVSSVPARLRALREGGQTNQGDRMLRGETGLRELFDEGYERPGEIFTSGDKTLGSICTVISTGLKSARSAKTQNGHFVIKVGNLTGHGVDWTPRSRNFVQSGRTSRRDATVQVGDILMTAAAHHARYIGLKVDLITSFPEYLAQPVFFSGEVLRIRVEPTLLDPTALYLWLRSPEGYARLQRFVRGQTAHLYPDDVRGLRLDPSAILRVFDTHCREETRSCIESEQKLQSRWNALESKYGIGTDPTRELRSSLEK